MGLGGGGGCTIAEWLLLTELRPSYYDIAQGLGLGV